MGGGGGSASRPGSRSHSRSGSRRGSFSLSSGNQSGAEDWDDDNASTASGSTTASGISTVSGGGGGGGVDCTEASLIALAKRILTKYGSVPVGKMGSLLHKAANNHNLPTIVKERYGGLKKFLQSHEDHFALGDDHP